MIREWLARPHYRIYLASIPAGVVMFSSGWLLKRLGMPGGEHVFRFAAGFLFAFTMHGCARPPSRSAIGPWVLRTSREGVVAGLSYVIARSVVNGTASMYERLDQIARWVGASDNRRAIAFLVVFAIGSLGYLIRKFARVYYAAGELFAALILAWCAFDEVKSSLATLASLLGAFYVIVRGLDNLSEGLKERRHREVVDEHGRLSGTGRTLSEEGSITIAGDNRGVE